MGTDFQKRIRENGQPIGTVWVTHNHPSLFQAVAVDGAALWGGRGWVDRKGYRTVADAENAIRRYEKGKNGG